MGLVLSAQDIFIKHNCKNTKHIMLSFFLNTANKGVYYLWQYFKNIVKCIFANNVSKKPYAVKEMTTYMQNSICS